MSEQPYRIRAGALHFLHTSGPRGFLLKFALAYGFLSMILQVVALWTQGPVYELYLRACAENGCDLQPYLDDLNTVSAQTNAASLLMLPVTLAMWIFFETASQRRYMRGEGFSLKFGTDEGRIAVVALLWATILIGGYIAIAIAVVVPALIGGLVFGAPGAVIVGGLVFIVLMIAGLYVFARLSPASALTLRDRQIRFFESWAVTKGRGFRLTGSYLLLFGVFMVLMLGSYALLFGAGYLLLAPAIAAAGGKDVGDAVMAAMAQPGFWAPMSIAAFLMLTMFSVFAHAMGGPAAALVKQQTDVGDLVITHTFD